MKNLKFSWKVELDFVTQWKVFHIELKDETVRNGHNSKMLQLKIISKKYEYKKIKF